MSPSEAEVEARGTLCRRLGAKEIELRIESGEIGRMGTYEKRIAWAVLDDLAAEKKALRPNRNRNAIGLGAFLVAAIALTLRIMGII